jgi:hypothetical protein
MDRIVHLPFSHRSSLILATDCATFIGYGRTVNGSLLARIFGGRIT